MLLHQRIELRFERLFLSPDGLSPAPDCAALRARLLIRHGQDGRILDGHVHFFEDRLLHAERHAGTQALVSLHRAPQLIGDLVGMLPAPPDVVVKLARFVAVVDVVRDLSRTRELKRDDLEPVFVAARFILVALVRDVNFDLSEGRQDGLRRLDEVLLGLGRFDLGVKETLL